MIVPNDSAAAPDTPDAEPNPLTDLPGRFDPLSKRDPRYWKILLRHSLAPHRPKGSLSGFLDDALHEMLPDPYPRDTALRHLIARLSYAAGPASPALRVRTLKALRDIANQHAAPTQTSEHAGPTPADSAEPLPEPRDTARLLTTRAGLVLFHPYIKMLFHRLDLLDDDQSIRPECLPKARATLRLISSGARPDDHATDPLEKVLLGLPLNWKHPETTLTDPPDAAIVDGLVNAVIDRWGALGQTSPDGLREAFVRRNGTMSQDENGIYLTVDPGPFDMLLDRLPWGYGTVALPWMDLPCHVDWR